MTSIERHQRRYMRRKIKRLNNKVFRNEQIGNLENIFSYHDMFYYGLQCCKNVMWKQSVQTFRLHLLSGTATRKHAVLNDTWIQKKCVHFMLAERGKIRPIDAPHISDRQIHKTFSNNVFNTIYTPYMIHDNGASQRGKGLYFSQKRLKKHLRAHYKKYGRNGYIVLIDLKQFFPTAPREKIRDRHKLYFTNEEIVKFADYLIDILPTDTGMPLGIETSQLEMVSLPTAIDTYFKCQLGVKGYAHYMDDFYMIAETKERAHFLLNKFEEKITELGLNISKNKSKIIPLTKSFKYCKTKYTLCENGKIVTHAARDSVKRARHKLKSFKTKYDNGEMTLRQVQDYVQSQVSYFKPHNDHIRILKIKRLYYALFLREREN